MKSIIICLVIGLALGFISNYFSWKKKASKEKAEKEARTREIVEIVKAVKESDTDSEC